MADLEKFFSKFRLVKKRSGKLTIIAIVTAIVLSMGALTALHLSMSQLKNRTEDLRDKAAQLEAENAELQEKLDVVDSVEGVENIAQDELDLVDPDTIVIVPEP